MPWSAFCVEFDSVAVLHSWSPHILTTRLQLTADAYLEPLAASQCSNFKRLFLALYSHCGEAHSVPVFSACITWNYDVYKRKPKGSEQKLFNPWLGPFINTWGVCCICLQMTPNRLVLEYAHTKNGTGKTKTACSLAHLRMLMCTGSMKRDWLISWNWMHAKVEDNDSQMTARWHISEFGR